MRRGFLLFCALALLWASCASPGEEGPVVSGGGQSGAPEAYKTSGVVTSGLQLTVAPGGSQPGTGLKVAGGVGTPPKLSDVGQQVPAPRPTASGPAASVGPDDPYGGQSDKDTIEALRAGGTYIPEMSRERPERVEPPPLPPEQGPSWNGTGHPDPEPLRAVPDAEILRRAMSDGDGRERLDALVSAGRRKIPGALEAAKKALRDRHQIVRTLALSCLIEHGGPEALRILWDVARSHPEEMTRADAMYGIAMYGPAEVLQAVEYAFSQSSSMVLGSALLQLVKVPDRPETFKYLERGLAHPDQIVWQEAAVTLGQIGGREAMRILKAAWRVTEDKRKRASLEIALDRAYRKGWRDQEF